MIFRFDQHGKLGRYRYDVYHKSGAYAGICYQEVEGYYVFWPNKNRDGFWTASELREIADKIDACNKDWDEQVKRDQDKAQSRNPEP